jgi:hypothetical protein
VLRAACGCFFSFIEAFLRPELLVFALNVEKVFIKCRKRQKKFAELKKLRIFAARLGNRNRFLGGN